MRSTLQQRKELTKGVLRIGSVNKDVRFAGSHIVSIDRTIPKRLNQLVLEGNQRVVIGDRVRGELKDELITHGGFGSNEKEISHGGVSWQRHWGHIRMGPLASSSG
jgi:hypothetical protein